MQADNMEIYLCNTLVMCLWYRSIGNHLYRDHNDLFFHYSQHNHMIHWYHRYCYCYRLLYHMRLLLPYISILHDSSIDLRHNQELFIIHISPDSNPTENHQDNTHLSVQSQEVEEAGNFSLSGRPFSNHDLQ